MEPLGYSLARWVGGGWDAIERADKVRTIKLIQRRGIVLVVSDQHLNRDRGVWDGMEWNGYLLLLHVYHPN